jgi:poly(A) polymerase
MNFINTIQDQQTLFQIHQFVNQHNIEAYIVGGFVRDLVLGVESKDIDIVVVGKPGHEFALEVAAFLEKPEKFVRVFKNFGTAQFVEHGVEFEFVGARKESYRTDSRKPIVENGTLQEDQERRDFTINAMGIDLRNGDLIDPFDGVQDLEDGIIRTPIDADITFSDDPLRQLRCVRFASRFNFVIEDKTKAAINKNIHRLKIVSSERILVELDKIVTSSHPSYGISLLDETGLLARLIPELLELKGVDTKNGFRHKNNWKHTLQVLDQTVPMTSDPIIRWTALLHDVAKGRTKRFQEDIGWTFHHHEEEGAKMAWKICSRLRMSSKVTNRIVKLIKFHGRPKQLVDDGISDSAIRRLVVELGELLPDLLTFVSCDITTRHEDKRKRQVDAIIDLFERIKKIEEKDSLRNFKVPLDGTEIMKVFNIPPGRQISVIKNAVKEAIIKGEITNDHDSALEFAKQNFS